MAAAAIALAVAAYVVLGCGDGDDDGAMERTGDDDDTCLDDQPPELLSVEVVVNGETVQTPVTIQQSDQLELSIEYNDVDCNLDGGGPILFLENENAVEGLPDAGFADVGCSSEERGAPFLFPVNPFHFGGTPHDISLLIADACGLQSNMILLEIRMELDES
jgi:hypothetical protein